MTELQDDMAKLEPKEVFDKYVKMHLDRQYELLYIDYGDNLDDNLSLIQQCIDDGNIDALYDSMYDWYSPEYTSSVMSFAIDIIFDKLKKIHGDVNADELIELTRDFIEDEIYARDESKPLEKLLSNTKDIVAYISTGHYPEYGMSDEECKEELLRIKRILRITPKNKTFDKKLMTMIIQASYGGKLVIYFNIDGDQLNEFIDNTNKWIEFTNPFVAIIDEFNGSGDHCQLKGHKFHMGFYPARYMSLDKLKYYSYTYNVCGMIPTWCEGTLWRVSKKRPYKATKTV